MNRLFGYILTASAALAFTSFPCLAEVKLPKLFGDNMVLQREADASVWGKATPGAKVVVEAGWLDSEVVTTADSEGNWKMKLTTVNAGGPYTIRFTDKSEKDRALRTKELVNVMLGDVWICSGQSNMGMSLSGYTAQAVDGAAEIIMAARPSRPIRSCVVRGSKTGDTQDYSASWMQSSPETVAWTSAVAYCFADAVERYLGIPVGLIVSCAGGTKIEGWIEENAAKEYYKETGVDKEVNNALYRRLLEPQMPFTFKGMIWYQGESDVCTRDYDVKMKYFIKGLRDAHGEGDFPVYIVQIAPFGYEGQEAVGAPYLMECQHKAARSIGNCHLVTTLDCGLESTIHPGRKKPIGDRLAWLVLQEEFGVKAIEARAPECVEVRFDAQKVYARFDQHGIGFLGQKMPGFELAGEDRVFYPAVAEVVTDSVKHRDTVMVMAEDVKKPVALRYCFHCWNGQPVIFNAYGIPAGPFRTDDWDPESVTYAK